MSDCNSFIENTKENNERLETNVHADNSKVIAKLEKENAELKNIADFQTSSNMDRYFQLKRCKEQIAELEKENAEVRDYRLSTLAKEQSEVSKYALNLEHKLEWYDNELTKAKEILKRILHTLKNEDSDYTFALKNTHPVLIEAEQFLNNSINEKEQTEESGTVIIV